jgi:uncharacterized protein involved in outer membrane biogenesis
VKHWSVKRWLWVALGALALAIAVGAGLLATIDFDAYARARLGLVEQATGRSLKVGGKLSVRLLPRIVLVAEDLSFANAKWGSQPEMLRVKRLEAVLAILPLLRRELEVSRLVLIEPQLLLETDAAGKGNWILDPKKAAPASGGAGESFGIAAPSIVVEHGQVTRRDRKETLQLAIDRLALERTGERGTARVELKAAWREQSFTVQGTVGEIARLIDGREWPVDLVFEVPGTELKFAGDLNRSGQRTAVSGKLNAEVRDLAALSKLAGAGIDLPTPATLQATIAGSGDQQRIEPLVLRFGKTAIEGSAAIRTAGAKPRISARLASPDLDLARPVGKESPGAAKGRASDRVFSDTRLPFASLNRVDADLDLRVDRLRLPDGLQLANLRARAALAGGRLLIEPMSGSVAQGTVSGRVDVQAAATPRTALKLDAKQVSLSTLAAQLGKPGKFSGGAADAAVDLVMTGDSMRAMAGGAAGTIRLSVGQAQLAGELPFGDFATALLAALSPGRRLEPGTRVDCAVAVLPFQGGVAKVDRSIAIETSKFDIVASGTIDLRSERLDLSLRPTVKQGLSGTLNIARFVSVRGTLADPKIGIDEKDAIAGALSMGAAAATGGLSMLGKSLLNAPADPHPCVSALGAKPAADPKPAPQQLDPSTLLKGLFGKR